MPVVAVKEHVHLIASFCSPPSSDLVHSPLSLAMCDAHAQCHVRVLLRFAAVHRKLGKPKSPNQREDLASPGVNANHFGSSLRASTNQLPNMRSSMRGSMRSSTRDSLRGSADNKRTSANALRNSTSSLPLSAQRPGSARPASAKVSACAAWGLECSA